MFSEKNYVIRRVHFGEKLFASALPLGRSKNCEDKLHLKSIVMKNTLRVSEKYNRSSMRRKLKKLVNSLQKVKPL